MLSTESTLSQVQFDDDNLCCPRLEMVQGSEEERNVVKEIGVGEGGVERKGGTSKPAELPVNSIDVQSQKVGGGYGRKEVKEQKVKESVAVKGDGDKRWELRPKPTKKQKMKQEKEKARAEKLEAESLRQKREMMPTHSSRQVFTLLPQEGDSEAVLLYKEKKREYWKEVGRLARAGIPKIIQGLPVPVKPAEIEN
uniref:Uncharacterized protein n=1 Tax=Chromera velia CCMP2878 TaxID=1169474 RepID=A0A0G4I7M3_9ALVE|eukprot:Cvel_11710.t1-p1 / transcript=Cvel_11710.t1 / gene=Cvel_11710 / organism=Chromera_velia_CCMP2878 / gene_product=hypothetical protein / transcript_product=hypothetical protein / location=Cvel_scaffold743:24251-24835(+) / protein_length=195 / sequence_SO=supercontig / SO=protein_coding / is_pseudo=false